eukprot:ctg_3596.g571
MGAGSDRRHQGVPRRQTDVYHLGRTGAPARAGARGAAAADHRRVLDGRARARHPDEWAGSAGQPTAGAAARCDPVRHHPAHVRRRRPGAFLRRPGAARMAHPVRLRCVRVRSFGLWVGGHGGRGRSETVGFPGAGADRARRRWRDHRLARRAAPSAQ